MDEQAVVEIAFDKLCFGCTTMPRTRTRSRARCPPA